MAASVAPLTRFEAPTSSDAPEYRVGQTLGGTYKISSILDCGGMAAVYRAEHLRLKRPVAIKVMSAALCADRHAHARFRREAELVGQLVHPHIVQVLDHDKTDRGEPYLVMELLEGETLARRLLREGALPLCEVVSIVTQIASALRCAHDAGVVHRDLKPSNVFLIDLPEEPPFVKLLDFGISKQVNAGSRITAQVEVLGTPDYMSPEQASGRAADVDHRTDQFGLAVVAYEMVSGRHPFWHDDVEQTVQKIVDEQPESVLRADSELPAALDRVLRCALSKNPKWRYENVTAFAAAFAAAAGMQGALEPKGQAPSEQDSVQLCSVIEALEHARRAFEAGDLDAAVEHADLAMDLAESSADAACVALMDLSRSMLERIFTVRVGRLNDTLKTARSATSRDSLSPREAFLLSRVGPAISAEELLQVAGMERNEALRHVATLLSKGLLRSRHP